MFSTIRLRGKPVTFADIRAVVLDDIGAKAGSTLRVSFERSLRRALHKLVKDGMLIAIGDGGRGDPLRYFLDPILMALCTNDEAELKALQAGFAADPGAEQAAAKLMVRMRR